METTDISHPRTSYDIDLFTLITQLWKSKLLILFTTAIFTFAGVAYTLLSTPAYQSDAVIVPPSPTDLIEVKKVQGLLLITSHSSQHEKRESDTPETLFENFLLRLNSNRYKDSFLSQEELLAYFQTKDMTQLQARKAFDRALRIQIPKKKPYNQVTLSLETNSPELSSRWLNEYIQYAQVRFVEELTNSIESQISATQNNLHLIIESKKANYRSNLIEEIENLEEALQITKEIGLTDPIPAETISYQPQVLDQMRNIYRLGSRSLNAEINALKARLEDINNTPGLSDEKLKLELLSNINIQKQSIGVMTLDLAAQANPKPTKPNKTLIISLSLILGGVAGILTALVKNSFIRRQHSMQ